MRSLLLLLASVVIVAGTVFLLGPRRPTQAAARKPLSVPAEAVDLEGAELQGSPDAPVVLIEFADFQCPYCARFVHDVLPQVRSEFVKPGLVQLAFRHFPLEMHPQAEPAAEAAACAAEQGLFWQAHDAFYESKLTADLAAREAGLRLDKPQFDACLAGPAKTKVRLDTEMGERLGVVGTPAFFVGRRVGLRARILATIEGAYPFDRFESALRSALAAK